MLNTLTLAISWEPELKGIFVVLIMVLVLIGASYMILATNVGSRLGFLVVMAALFGWMTTMGAVWWVYGIGLQGQFPSWQPVATFVGTEALGQEQIVVGDSGVDPSAGIETIPGWTKIQPEEPSFGQAQAASDDILINQAGLFSAGEYITVGAYSTGGGGWPNIGGFDWFAFFHDPHHVIVEVKPVVSQVAEPGKPPPTPIADETQDSTFVLMVRDMGYRRRPAALITLGSAIIFGLSVWALARRERLVNENLEQAEDPVRVPVKV